MAEAKGDRPPGLPGTTTAWLAGCGLALAAALALAPRNGLWAAPAIAGLTIYAIAARLILLHLPGPRRLGLANRITLARFAASLFLAALALRRGLLGDELRLIAAALGGLCLLADGLDGWTARRRGEADRFGARFDLESDSVFLLTITLLLLRTGEIAAWILVIGVARYTFVLAGRLWPPLARALPDSRRRKSFYVATVIALLLALSPFFGGAADRGLCAAGLVMIVASFAMDCLWLLHTTHLTRPATAWPAPPGAALK